MVRLLLVASLLGTVAACASNAPRRARDAGTDTPTPLDSSLDGPALDSGRPDSGAADTGAADTGAVDTGAADTGAADTGAVDTGTADTGVGDTGTADTGVADTGVADTGAADTGATDAGPPSTPTRGTYRYTRLPVGGLREVHRVAFHPDGSYALALEKSGRVHVYDWSSSTDSVVDLDPPGSATMALDDVVFDPTGTFAIVVGTRRSGSMETGVVYRFDDAMWRAGMGAASITAEASAERSGQRFRAVAYPWGDGMPMVLADSDAGAGHVATLRRYDPAAGDFGSFISARATSAGCDDLAFVNNEFGGEGVAIVCGSGGADAPYWTEIGGVEEWRPGPSATLGNTSRIDAHPGGDYALAIGWSGRRIHRFEAGAWVPTSSALWYSRLGIWGVHFQEDGRRALIVGCAGGSPLAAPVLEFRHDLYSVADVAVVSIPSFDAAPYLGDSNVYLEDAAFRPGCDGGLLVGGKTNFSGSTGWLIEFSLEGGRSCGGVI